MDRLKVGIIFGGCSEEHPVSVKSAQEVAKNLDAEKYEPFWIGITKSGAWKLCDGPDGDWENGSCRPAVLSPDRGVHGLLVLGQGQYETISLDLVLPVLHGKLGEDGAMQGLLELSGIPYAGCDVQSSALCMDKSLAYIVARSAGIATPNFWAVTANENIDTDRLTYPCFMRWSKQPEDRRTKPQHYPNIDRAEMFEKGYVAAKSGHSRGGTVDLTLYHLVTGELAPMGGDHDLMDPISHHGVKGITQAEARNRQYLCSIMEACGFNRYDCEWWHYTLKDEPYPDTYFDFPIT